MITVKKKLVIDDTDHIIDFRQFESIKDILTYIPENKLLVFINTAILDHDRKALRKAYQDKNTLDITLYEKEKRFQDL